MTKRVDLTRPALRALVPICQHVVEWPMDPANWPIWRDALCDVLADVSTPSDAMAALVYAAEQVAHAAPGERDQRLSRLRFELRAHFAHAAALALEDLRAIRRDTSAGMAA